MALASALSQAHHGEPLSSLLPVPWCDRPGTGDRASMPRELLLSLEWPGCAAGLQRGAGGRRPRRPDGRSALPEHPDVGRFFLPLVLVLVLGALAFPAQREGFLAAVGPSWPWGPWSPFPGRVAVGDAPGLGLRKERWHCDHSPSSSVAGGSPRELRESVKTHAHPQSCSRLNRGIYLKSARIHATPLRGSHRLKMGLSECLRH